MPREIDDDTKKEIVMMRAQDYEKQEIAEELDISRNTVTKHLKEIRESEDSDAKLRQMILGAGGALGGAMAGGPLGAGLGAYLAAKLAESDSAEDVHETVAEAVNEYKEMTEED